MVYKDAVKRLDEDEKSGVVLTDPHGRQQETNCINEPGLYALVLGSRKPEAKAFKRWITHEVIPSIRRTGGYSLPEDYPAALRALAEAEERKQALFRQNDQLKTQLDQSREWYSIKRVAALNGVPHRRFDWRKLKRESIRQEYGVKKIFDANYGEVNVYHAQVWETVYPDMEL